MLVIEGRTAALFALIVSLCMLGTWPACLRYPEFKFRRTLSHSYLDYSISFFVTAISCSLLLGQLGSSSSSHPNVLVQLWQPNLPCAVFSMIGGMLLTVGNLCLQYGMSLIGLAVCLPLQASLTIIIGTSVNYYLDNGLNDPLLLSVGVFFCCIAIAFGTLAHVCHSPANMEDPVMSNPSDSIPLVNALKKGENIVQIPVEPSKLRGMFGITVSIVGGFCFGGFSPCFNIATNDQFGLLPPGVPPLTVYTSYFYFASAFFFTSTVVNMYFLHCPVSESRASSLALYLKDNKGRVFAILAGIICGLGNGMQFLGGQAAGYAAADLVQAYPIVGFVWGIFLFKEMSDASQRVGVMLGLMNVAYIIAILFLGLSAKSRNR